METAKVILYILEGTLLAYFAIAAIYVFVFAFAGLFPMKAKKAAGQQEVRRIAVLIPGYKEDAVIVDVAEDALRQDYPHDFFDVVVIADSFQPITIDRLKQLPIKLVEVSFEKSTKSKALNRAMAEIGNRYDIALVLDADNLMAPGFLASVDNAFGCGYTVVQGHRVAKNTNTPFAILDAISEEVNNHIFRKGHRVLGLSSALIGSGMAFSYPFFKTTMAEVNAVGGFDKELELRLLRKGATIEYLHNALVLDEKVQQPEVFANQRKRWLSAQFVYFRRYFADGLIQLIRKGNIDYFDKVYQMVSPPRVLLLGVTSLFLIAHLVALLVMGSVPLLFALMWAWAAVVAVVYMAFLFAVPRKFYNLATVRAIVSLPKAFALMFLSLFKLKGANQRFIHTAHGVGN